MGRRYRNGNGPDQLMLMPADPRQWLPAGHLAWRVIEQAAEMDLSGFGAACRPDGQGGVPYHPRMMATLLLYCYCRGRRSSREIEMATHDDVGARVICGGLHPRHSAIAEFVRQNLDAVCALLPESVKACAAEGLVSVELVAGDGTKLKANAAMAANLTREQLDAQIAGLEARIDAQFRGWARDMLGGGDLAPAPPGDGDGDGTAAGGTTGARQPRRPELVLRRREAARAELAARQDAEGQREKEQLQARTAQLAARIGKKEAAVLKWEKAASDQLENRARKIAAGQRIPGTRPIASIDDDRDVKRARKALAGARADYEAACQQAAAPAGNPDTKVNATDPSSRVMPLKKGGFDQLHNVQALAVAKTQVILAIMRHPSPVDVAALLPLLAEARRVLRAAGITGEILSALFDAGYASDASFTAGIPEKLYIAITREARQTGRSADGRAPATMLPSWEDMTARLDTDEGRQLCRQRAATIEPVFAQLTARLGRTLHYRGHAVDAELALWAASHNILKAITARARRLARATATITATPAAA